MPMLLSCCSSSSSAAWPRPACRWPSAASRSSARSPRCGCHPGHRRVDLRGQHRHDARASAWRSTTPVRGQPVPRGARRGQPTVEDAVARTMATAGRTVAVSGVTVAMSLAGLLLFPQVFLRSMGFGGMARVLVAMVAALTVLPALLAVLGPRVDALRIRRSGAGGPRRGRDARRLGPAGAQRHAPAGALRGRDRRRGAARARRRRSCGSTFGGIDARVLPAGTEPRVVAETLEPRLPRRPGRPDRVRGAVRRPGRRLAARPPRCVVRAALPHVAGVDRRPGHRRYAATSRAIDVRTARPDSSAQARAHRRCRSATCRAPGRRARCWSAGRPRSSSTCWPASAPAAVDGAGRGRRHVRAAVPRLRLGGAAGQGDGDERAVAGGVVRRRGLDLPGRPPVRAAGLHARPGTSSRPSRS